MKFGGHKYWRHQNALEAFIRITSIVFDDDGKNAILNVVWCTQSREAWWPTYPARLKIEPDQYNNWLRYKPYGQEK